MLQMYKQSLLLLLFLQKDVTTDESAWTADWCWAFQFMLVGSSWYKSWHFLGTPLAPRPRKLTRKINCLANRKGLVNPNQREAGWQSSLQIHGKNVSGEKRHKRCLPFWSVLQALRIHGLNYTANALHVWDQSFRTFKIITCLSKLGHL